MRHAGGATVRRHGAAFMTEEKHAREMRSAAYAARGRRSGQKAWSSLHDRRETRPRNEMIRIINGGRNGKRTRKDI
jgi:hypothetical protein